MFFFSRLQTAHLPTYTQATALPTSRSPVSSVGIAQTITVSASQLTSIPHVQGSLLHFFVINYYTFIIIFQFYIY